MAGGLKRGPWSSGDRILAGVIGLVFVGQFIIALGYPPEAGLFPLFVCGVGAVLAFAVVLGFGQGQERRGEGGFTLGKLVIAFAAPPVYGFALWLLGYWVASFVAIPAVALLLGYRRLVPLALVTIGLTAAVGFLFPLLKITLPTARLAGILS